MHWMRFGAAAYAIDHHEEGWIATDYQTTIVSQSLRLCPLHLCKVVSIMVHPRMHHGGEGPYRVRRNREGQNLTQNDPSSQGLSLHLLWVGERGAGRGSRQQQAAGGGRRGARREEMR